MKLISCEYWRDSRKKLEEIEQIQRKQTEVINDKTKELYGQLQKQQGESVKLEPEQVYLQQLEHLDNEKFSIAKNLNSLEAECQTLEKNYKSVYIYIMMLCVCVCVCLCDIYNTHMHMHIYIYIYCTYILTAWPASRLAFRFGRLSWENHRIHTYAYIFTYTYINIHTHTCMPMLIFYAWSHTHTYIYIYIQLASQVDLLSDLEGLVERITDTKSVLSMMHGANSERNEIINDLVVYPEYQKVHM